MEKFCRTSQATDVSVIRRMRFCILVNEDYTHLEYVIRFDFPLRHWLHERASVLRYTYIACVVVGEIVYFFVVYLTTPSIADTLISGPDPAIWARLFSFNPLNRELNPICYLLALLGAHHFLHVSRIRVKLLTLKRLMSYIYIWSTHS